MITTLVTGVGGGGNGEQLVKCLRLSNMGYRIVGTDLLVEAARQCQPDVADQLPLAGHPDYVARLIDLCLKHHVDAVFPGSEPELRRISKEAESIRQHVKLLAVNNMDVVDTCSNKFKTFDFLRKHNFPYPQTWLISSVEGTQAIDDFPVIIKPVVGGGSQHVYVVQDKDELLLLVSYLVRYFSEILVQEYVGRVDQEFTVGVLLDAEGNLINSIALNRMILSSLSNRVKVKNRTNRTELGEILAVSSGISQGRISTFPEVTEFCEKLALSLDARYAINVQCRLVEGKPYVFEINPRFSGTSSIRALLGFNEPDTLIRLHILGEVIEPWFSYRHATVLRGLREIVVDEH